MAHLQRREVIGRLGGAAAGLLLTPSVGLSQVLGERRLIGFLSPSSKTAGQRFYSGFPLGMQELGYVENRDYVIEARYANGDLSQLHRLAEELVALRPNVIVAGTLAAALAAKRATDSIPIVGMNLVDPVRHDLIVSEARPGRNVTGTIQRLDGLTGKQLEIARDLVPTVAKVGVLANPNNPFNEIQRREAEAAAKNMGIRLATIEVRAADEVGPAFESFLRERTNVVFVLADAMFMKARRSIAAFALASRIPTVYSFREHVEDFGLISYGIDLRESFRRAAFYVDRILKGEKPANLPVEFPTKLELVINLATAKALGLEIPPTLLARADEVIE
jgi:putative ABC transport system substrate-binding protein